MSPSQGPPGAVSPSQWRARVNYDRWTDRYTPDDGIAIHYGGGANIAGDASRAAGAGYDWPSVASEMHVLRLYESFHLSKGWRGLAYGWAVGQSGTVYRIRGWNRYGAHLGDVDGDGVSNNSEVIPVLFILGRGQPPTEASLLGFESLRLWLETQSGHSLALRGHQEVQPQPTSCPGAHLMEYVRANRESSGEPVPEPDEEDTVYDVFPTVEQTYPPTVLAEGSEDRFYTRVVQYQLALHGEVAANTFNDQHQPDGIFGPGTKAAVVRFQTSQGLVTDGVVGSHTWEQLLTP